LPMVRVLLVEDDDQINHLLCGVIRQAGHHADCVKTKTEALRLLNSGSHELVICDVLLPDGTGHEIRGYATTLGMRVVLMSGHPDEVRELTRNKVPHLAKPFALAEFEQVLRSVHPTFRA